jgi:hypothetical protein
MDDKKCYGKIIDIYQDFDEEKEVCVTLQWYYSYHDFLKKDEDGVMELPGGRHELASYNFEESDYALAPDHEDEISISYIDSLATNNNIESTPFRYNSHEHKLCNTHLSFNTRENDGFAAIMTCERSLMFKECVPFGCDFYARFIKPYFYFGQVERSVIMWSTLFHSNTTIPKGVVLEVTKLPSIEQDGICSLCQTRKALSYEIKNMNLDGVLCTDFKVGVHCFNRLQYVARLLTLIVTTRAKVSMSILGGDATITDMQQFMSQSRQRIMNLADYAERNLR